MAPPMRGARGNAAASSAEPGFEAEAPRIALSRTFADVGRMVWATRGMGARWRAVAALGLTALGKAGALAGPVALGVGINRLAAGEPALGAFFVFAGIWAGARLVSGLYQPARDAVFAPVVEDLQRQIMNRFFDHAMRLSVAFHQSKRTGTLQRVMERGSRAVQFLLRFLVFTIGPTVIELAAAAVVLGVAYGPLFAVIAVASIGLYAWVTLGLTEWRLEHRREMNERGQEAAGRQVDAFLNVETVKSFAAEEREAGRIDRALTAYARAASKASQSLAALNAAQAAIMTLGLAAMVAAAGYETAMGRMGPGDITATILILSNLYQPLNILGWAWREIKQSVVDMERLYQLLDMAPDIADAPGARRLEVTRGEVRFEAVSFRHPGRAAGIEAVSFTVPAGRSVGLVGPSGAGKSTLLRLLLRFYEPDEGRVTIDGQDIAAVTQESLRAGMGLVPQDVVLFNDTLHANISYGDPDAGEEAVWEAARRAGLGPFIEALPEGLSTRVGERGLKLSGGERQRVGLARAILKNPPILLLDEATSALDSVTEAQVQAALREAARGRTTVTVAHRLSTVFDCDVIIVLDEGRIAEQGDHAELMARDGLYARLWRRQSESGGEGAPGDPGDQAGDRPLTAAQ